MKGEYWIYKIINPSGKIYIGITRNIVKRLTAYKTSPDPGQTAIYNSLRKYGWDAHIKEILFIGLKQEEAEAKEIELIKFYKDSKNCLNIANGGLNGKRRDDVRSNNKATLQFDLEGNFIKEWDSLSSIRKVLNFNRGNIGKICREKTFFQHGFLWCFKKDYEEGIRPIYKPDDGQNSCKPIQKLNKDGVLIEEFKSVVEAVKESTMKNKKRRIQMALKTEKPDRMGYFWKYKIEV